MSNYRKPGPATEFHMQLSSPKGEHNMVMRMGYHFFDEQNQPFENEATQLVDTMRVLKAYTTDEPLIGKIDPKTNIQHIWLTKPGEPCQCSDEAADMLLKALGDEWHEAE